MGARRGGSVGVGVGWVDITERGAGGGCTHEVKRNVLT